MKDKHLMFFLSANVTGRGVQSACRQRSKRHSERDHRSGRG